MNFDGTILIADDEAHVRKYIGLLLGRIGHPTIVEAADGLAAVNLWRQVGPDLVLLDVNMPMLDGIGALARIKASDSSMPVIMLTSLANRGTVEECARLGAAGFLRKDLPRDELIFELRRIIAAVFEPADSPDLPKP